MVKKTIKKASPVVEEISGSPKVKEYIIKNKKIILKSSAIALTAFLIVGLISGLGFYGYNEHSKLVTLEEKMDAVYDSLNKYPQLAPKPIKLPITKPDISKDRWYGSQKARFVIVLYTDLECPYCQTEFPVVKEFVKNNSDIALVVRHFPLTSLHENAKALAVASECVAKKSGDSKFYDFVSAVYNGDVDMTNGIGDYLNESEIQDCQNNNDIINKVDNDFLDGSNNSITATPTMVFYHLSSGKTKVLEGSADVSKLDETLKTLKERV